MTPRIALSARRPLHQWLACVLGLRAGPPARANKPASFRFRPLLEAMETRDLPSGGISLVGNIVHIRGTPVADEAVVRIDGGRTADPTDDQVIVRLSHNGHIHRKEFALPDVSRVTFVGGQGNDRFQDFTPLPSVARCVKGQDTLIGGQEDTLLGGRGNNTLIYLPNPGSIKVKNGEVQTIWSQAGQFRDYRITCTSGTLNVIWHDLSTGLTNSKRLQAGQSYDVRSDSILVAGISTVPEGESSGTYERLPEPSSNQ